MARAQSAGGALTASDLGAYSSVIWVADDRNILLNGVPAVSQHLEDCTAAIAEYATLGGNVLLMGWKQAGGFTDQYPVAFGPGDLLHDAFRVAGVSVTGPGQYFWGVAGEGIYTDVVVDTTTTRAPWVGKLPESEYLTGIAAGGEVAYTFRSSAPDSAFANAPCGVRYDGGSFRTAFFDFPLCHLREADARSVIVRAMSLFGEPPTGGAEESAGASAALPRILLWSAPNPGRPGTTIGYSLPAAADVDLSIFSPSGERVRLLDKGRREVGRRLVAWDGRNDAGNDVASGVYLFRIRAGSAERTRKLVLVR